MHCFTVACCDKALVTLLLIVACHCAEHTGWMHTDCPSSITWKHSSYTILNYLFNSKYNYNIQGPMSSFEWFEYGQLYLARQHCCLFGHVTFISLSIYISCEALLCAWKKQQWNETVWSCHCHLPCYSPSMLSMTDADECIVNRNVKFNLLSTII